MWQHGSWGWGWMAVAMVVFWAAVIVAVLVVVNRLGQSGRAEQNGPPSAELILADRLARGEITTAEYEERMRALRASR